MIDYTELTPATSPGWAAEVEFDRGTTHLPIACWGRTGPGLDGLQPMVVCGAQLVTLATWIKTQGYETASTRIVVLR